MIPFKKTSMATALGIALAVAISGCGGSSSSSSADEPAASRGVITGFGSIYVNGRRYDTDSASFDVDDSSGSESDLRVGMVVTVVGTLGDDGYVANSVLYDNELKGPVSDIVVDLNDSTVKTLTILGQQVLVNADTTIDDDGGLTFDTIAVGDVLEVSGFVSDSQLTATHIELQGTDEDIEIKGMIENLDTDSFEINGFEVRYDSTIEIDDDIDVLANDLYVEVEGELDAGGTFLIAEQIEFEGDDELDDVDDYELEGVISDYNATDMTFTVQGQTVDASNAMLSPEALVLADDLFVEVEGYLADGILYADEVELEDEQEFKGMISNYDAENMTFTVDGQTVDASDAMLIPADLVLANDLYVEVEGYVFDDILYAGEVELEDEDSSSSIN
jgi:hypothetical protein